MTLTFDQLRTANVARNDTTPAFAQCKTWVLSDWSNALAGEVGEACNIVKKIRRGSYVAGMDSKGDLAKELADVVTYADLLAAQIGIDLGEAVRAKFNEVSEKVESKIRL